MNEKQILTKLKKLSRFKKDVFRVYLLALEGRPSGKTDLPFLDETSRSYKKRLIKELKAMASTAENLTVKSGFVDAANLIREICPCR